MEYETNGKEAKINWADQESREIPVTYYPKNTDPSVFSTKSPRWVIQYSPSQVFVIFFYYARERRVGWENKSTKKLRSVNYKL
jgi:hypothetical protein